MQIDAQGEIYPATKKQFIAVLADTVIGDCLYPQDPYQSMEIVVGGVNTVPVTDIWLPVEFAGSLSLVLDSFSTTGCRIKLICQGGKKITG